MLNKNENNSAAMKTHQVIAPNLNGRVYRDFFPQQNVLNTFLDFIDVSQGDVLLGSSNLNGRFWDGSICYYRNVNKESEFDVEKPHIVECLGFGVTDGKFLPNANKVLIACDSGEIRLYTLEDIQNFEWLRTGNMGLDRHDDAVTEISLWPDSSFVSSSMDGSLKLWNISSDVLTHCSQSYNFSDAHTHLISSVSASKNDNNLFVSASYDRLAILWDKRTKEMEKVIYENEFCALTRLEWHPTKPNIVAIGTSSGDLYLVDVREPMEFLTKKTCFDRTIHRTSFSNQGLLAVCADDSKVMVLDCATDDMKIAYMDDQHNDYVRGFAWEDNNLFSCGWDKKVLIHKL